jgi:hypothetical protein
MHVEQMRIHIIELKHRNSSELCGHLKCNMRPINTVLYRFDVLLSTRRMERTGYIEYWWSVDNEEDE